MTTLRQRVRPVIPLRALRAYRSIRGQWDRNDLLFNEDADLGPMVRDVFNTVRDVPGYFTYDDCVAFSLILGSQTAAGLHGDIFEIGSYYGRSTAVLASRLRPGERLVVCETFEWPGGDDYPNPPSPEKLRETVGRLAPRLDPNQLQILQEYSTRLSFPDTQRFRFIHVDGGHNFDVALSDLRLAARHVLPFGIIVLDDYHHPDWTEVTAAADTFLKESPRARVMADVNRYGDSGRKLYITIDA